MIHRRYLSDLRGVAQLACDSTLGVTRVVEQMHGTIMRLPLPLGPMRQAPDAGLARLVYGSIRGTTRLVDRAIGVALDPWIDDPRGSSPSLPPAAMQRDSFVAALNGLCGDHLARSGNPLALPMTLRVGDFHHAPAIRGPRRWLILVHGLCMHDRQWRREGHDHGEALARELGFTPVYLRYNSGLGVTGNGASMAALLERFLRTHGADGADGHELRILSFSLGGLVTRSALAVARRDGHEWPRRLRQVVFLGTPHAGAPLALGGHVLDRALGLSPYSAAFARLGAARSRGLHDLRDGLGPGLHELPDGVSAYALAGAVSESPGRLEDRWVGDGLVPVSSALANLPDAHKDRAIPAARQWVSRGTGHLELLSDRAVYGKLLEWLRSK